ncbi:MAG: hypothetical protein JWL77_4422 [Chthonomonadaceae bacterium]|nr:hypothetical protein [Chthonomonadaceae bacterium]
MPVQVHLSKDRSKPQPENGPGEPTPAVAPVAARDTPFANVSRRMLIGGGTALLLILIGGIWFLFGVGPEDSGKAAADLNAGSASQSPAANAAGVSATPAGRAASPQTDSASTTNPGSGNASTPQGSAYNSETGAGPGSYAANGNGQNNASAPPADPNHEIQPGEVEGSPPSNSNAAKGTKWHPGAKPGDVITQGPASDP